MLSKTLSNDEKRYLVRDVGIRDEGLYPGDGGDGGRLQRRLRHGGGGGLGVLRLLPDLPGPSHQAGAPGDELMMSSFIHISLILLKLTKV